MELACVTEVGEMIDSLKDQLEHTLQEDNVLRIAHEGLERLRDEYRRNRGGFRAEQIAFLKLVAEAEKGVDEFVDLREELEEICDRAEYQQMITRLRRIREQVAGFAVGKRVDKEMRQLVDRLPEIQEREADLARSRMGIRASLMEEHPPRCSANHPMVLREKDGLYFWGCRRFPQCMRTKALSADEESYLRGRLPACKTS